MNAYMNKNGVKLLAVIAVLAMAVCAFAVMTPAVDATDAEPETNLPTIDNDVYKLAAEAYGTSDAPISISADTGNVSFVLDGVESSTVYLTYKATNDSNLLNAEWYYMQYKKLKAKLQNILKRNKHDHGKTANTQ